MSVKSFLSKIWASIKSLFDGQSTEFKQAVHIGVVIADNIKNFILSPAADVLTMLIPGDVDDKVKQWLREKLPAIMIQLKLVDGALGLTDPQEITAAAIKTLQAMDSNIKNAFLHNLSVMIAQVAADGKLTWSDGVYILEWYYQHEYKPAA